MNIPDNYSHPAVQTGDLNSLNNYWKYAENDDTLITWVVQDYITLVFNAKDESMIDSLTWNEKYKSDLAFLLTHHKGQPLTITGRVLESLSPKHKFQYQDPRPRRNFPKAYRANI